jgi:methylated-DNA-[protein]-cysteine S-methyltransferase
MHMEINRIQKISRFRSRFPSALAALVPTPEFALGVTLSAHDDALAGIHFLPADTVPVAAQTPLAREVVHQLTAWLLDARFVFDLPTVTQGTPFQQRVWALISAIPPGETRSYGELAAILGTAPRPVGAACGANPLPLVVPCHRVLARDGTLGGFARERSGFLLDIKRTLLAHEQAVREKHTAKIGDSPEGRGFKPELVLR